MTYLDEEEMSFAVFSTQDGKMGSVPTVIGRVFESGGDRTWVPELVIETNENYYVLRDPDPGRFIKVVERLPEGGFGRLVRYRGYADEGKWTDLEFIYEDRAGEVLVLDHAKGVFFRTRFTEERPAPDAVSPLKEELNGPGFEAALSGKSRGVLPAIGLGRPVSSNGKSFHSRIENLNGFDWWMAQLLRGPPAEGLLP